MELTVLTEIYNMVSLVTAEYMYIQIILRTSIQKELRVIKHLGKKEIPGNLNYVCVDLYTLQKCQLFTCVYLKISGRWEENRDLLLL